MDDEDTRAAFFDHLVRTQILLWNALDARLRAEHDLPLSWFEPMRVIDGQEYARVRDIATTLLITDGGASKLVDRIAAAGLLDRHRHPEDGRAAWLELTDAGRDVLSAADATFHDELRRRMGSTVSDARLRELSQGLADLRGLQERASEGPASRR